MNNHVGTDAWIYRAMIGLSLIVIGSAVGTIVLTFLGQSVSEPLIALGMAAGTALVRLLIPSLLI